MKREIEEQIAWEVIKTLIARFESFPEKALENRNAPFHKAFLKAFLGKFDYKHDEIF